MALTKTLFVWDFDNTIVLDNTDTLVFDRLGPHILKERRESNRNTPGPHLWTSLIAGALIALFEIGKTPEEILEAAAEACIPMETACALQGIASNPNTKSLVLSDANNLYINACLKKSGLEIDEVFEGGIFTNKATIEASGFISLKPFIAPNDKERQHNCEKCPANLCKGEVLQDLLSDEYQGWRIVYVGDGNNDYCPVMRMGGGDVALVRKGFPLHRRVLQKAPSAQVQLWESPLQLKHFVEDLF